MHQKFCRTYQIFVKYSVGFSAGTVCLQSGYPAVVAIFTGQIEKRKKVEKYGFTPPSGQIFCVVAVDIRANGERIFYFSLFLFLAHYFRVTPKTDAHSSFQ